MGKNSRQVGVTHAEMNGATTETTEQTASSTVDGSDTSGVGEEPEETGFKYFSTSRPRDATDGLAKGAGNIAKGVFGGITMMVAAPIQGGFEGAKDGGGTLGAAKGATMGLGIGLVGGVATE